MWKGVKENGNLLPDFVLAGRIIWMCLFAFSAAVEKSVKLLPGNFDISQYIDHKLFDWVFD